ncbi:MAG: GAF domain-containing protein, partial [Anaerolineae bacterium]
MLVDYNDAAQAITRGNVADFVGRAASEMYRDRPDIIEELSRCFAEKTSIKRVMEYGYTTTGETKHLAVTYVFVPPNLVMVHTEDITERKRTEEALRESEEKFKAQYKGIPVPTYTWQRVGEDFVLVAYNDGAEAITHGNVADFVGRTAGGMYRDRPDILEELSRSFIEKTTIKREMEYRFTTTGESKDLAVSYVFVPPDLVMVHTEDITQRKQAQREIEERRFYLEGLLTAAPDAIVTLDAHQRIVEWNPGAEKLFGYSQEEVIGRDIDDLITNSNTYEEAVGYTQMVMSGKDLPPVETVRYPKDGYPVDVLVAGSPILVGDELIGLVAVYTDITESKRVEKALERRATQLATVGEVGRQIASILDLDELLRQIVNLLEDAFGYRYAHIFLLDEDSNELVLRAGAGPPGRLLEGTRIAIEGRSINTCVARTGKPLLANDVAKERMYLHLEEVADTKSELAVPIKLKGEVIGTLDVQSTELNAFDESDLLTLQTLADQAAVAIENARLYEKEREQREEAETLRQATQALSTTLDLQEVFKSILSELQRVVPYDSASVHLLKGECLEIIGGHGFPNLDELLGISFPLNGDNPNRQVMATRAPFIVEDAPAVYSAFRKEPHAQAGIRAWLGVPLLFGDRLLGMIALDKQMPGFYTEEHARLALAFAAQAAVAIENARLHEETQRRLRELQMLHQASASILSTLELGKTLQLIMDSAVKAIP